MSEYIVAAVIGLVSGVVGAFVTGAFQHTKTQAEADKDSADANEVIRSTVMKLLKPLQDRVDDLEVELQDWQNWASALVVQLKGYGCNEPVPFKSSLRRRRSGD